MPATQRTAWGALYGSAFHRDSGSMLFATPSVRLRLPFGLRETEASLRMAVQLPLTQDWLHGFQREEAVWSVGLLLPF